MAVNFAGQHGLPFAVVAPLAQKLREATGQTRGPAPRSRSPAGTLGRSMPGRPGSSAGLPSGERMYRAALEAQHRREALAAAEHQRREAEALAACQPGPVINSRPRSLGRGQQEPAWKRLNALASSSAEHKERLAAQTRAAEQEAQLAACTFAPATTRQSSHLMADRQWAMRQAGVTAHDTLYADAQRRAARDAELSAWLPQEATFRPAVLPSAHVPVGAAGDVVQRLHQAGQRVQQQQGAAAAAARQVDPTTGRRLFVPDTGRRPGSVGAEPGAVHEHLYSLRDEYARKKEQLAEAVAAEEGANRAGASERSAALAESRRMRRFAQIFRALDTTRQGLLRPWDAATDALARLHPEIAGDVQLAASLSGDAEAVDEDAFCALMEAAVRISRTGPRGYLGASTGRTHAQEEADKQAPFAPRINDASRRLAARRRPADVPVHDILAQEQQRTQERLVQLAGERELAELAECTFRPSTAPPAHGRSSLAQASAPVTLSHVARLPPVPHGGVEDQHPGGKGTTQARFERNLQLRLEELRLEAAAPADGQDSAPYSPF